MTGPASAQGFKRETWIPIYVTPYYSAAEKAGGTPKVAVGNGLNDLLMSNKQSDILAARDLVQSAPEKVTPFAMMALAIRMYDTGLRDDSVFWFYVAKYRAITLVEAVRFESGPASDGVVDAVGSFIQLAGPYFNGYAFCNVEKQPKINTAAIDWVEAHPYATIRSPELASRLKPGGIDQNIKNAIAGIRKSAATEAAQLADPKQLKVFKETRKANGMDVKFCW